LVALIERRIVAGQRANAQLLEVRLGLLGLLFLLLFLFLFFLLLFLLLVGRGRAIAPAAATAR